MITVAACLYELGPQVATAKALFSKNIPFAATSYFKDKTAQALSMKHGFSSFPIVYCTDQDGNVFHSWCGYDAEQIADAIEGRFYE